MLLWKNEMYSISEKTKIYIYGAATTGAIFLRNLQMLNLTVCGFIDKRADEIDSYYGFPVYTVDKFNKIRIQDVVIIVAIKNVFEHEDIAKQLFNVGFSKIIFRPKAVVTHKNPMLLDRAVNNAYDKLLDGVNPDLVPCISNIENDKIEDVTIRAEFEDELIVNIPVPYVYVDDYKGMTKWSDIPCLGLFPHTGLFRYFLGHSAAEPDARRYIDYCRDAAERSGGIITSKTWEKSVVDRALDIFYNMEFSYNRDKALFCDNAVVANYNTKGYFNIKSGKHRCAYLIAKSEKYIPLRIRKSDYHKWCNHICAKEEAVFWQGTENSHTPVRFWNPYLYAVAGSSSSIYDVMLFEIIELIFRRKIDGKEMGNRIVIYDSYMEFYAPLFRMYGMDVSVIDKNRERRALYEDWCECKSVPTCIEESGIKYDFDYMIGENLSESTAKVRVNIKSTAKTDESPWLVGLSVGCPVYAYFDINEE